MQAREIVSTVQISVLQRRVAATCCSDVLCVSLQVKTLRVEKKVNEVLNRLNKTCEDKKPDLRAEREERDRREREGEKAKAREDKRRAKEEEEAKKREAELRYCEIY